MVPGEKPLVWLHGQIKTPPFSEEARIEAGYLLGRLQQGESLSLPHSRPMPSIGRRCHELRVPDKGQDWRTVYRSEEHTSELQSRLHLVCRLLLEKKKKKENKKQSKQYVN